MGKDGRLNRTVKSTKKAVRRIKRLQTLGKNRKRLGHVLRSVGQVIEKRL